ncbi:MAG TPA: sensor histidine kinase [Sphingomonas sp.]|uniref:sensor histidine kinase n=1 Tax=Sphingomonas sp. TaxID=28214 RepID=UPI002B8673E2|nr:sensor histidine kinase [Sphingomonas sp.]HMI17922.1 sensor histidine kinase [Sphingomonas sp.]
MASTPSAAPFFARLTPDRFSTGTKMLIILTVALLPLGLIALFASIQSAHAKQAQREADARVVATAEARQIDILLLRGAAMIRANLTGPLPDARFCHTLLERDQAAFEAKLNLALYAADGTLACATPGFAATGLVHPRAGALDTDLLPGEAGLRFTVPAPNGSYGIGEIPAPMLRQVLATGSNEGIVLNQNGARLIVSSVGRASPLVRRVQVSAPAASGQIRLQLTVLANPISAVEILLVLLPVLMWSAAAAICWVVLDQALVRPLRQMQRAIALYQPGDGPLILPRISTPAEEIRSLGEALESTAAQLVARELELEEGLSHQVRLTREVHHRVKNNLQVVASLINLHARGTEGDVAAAYASIQRRVDALAVVHRNHYAELEENRGVALRSIIAELTANLRATAPPGAQHLTITLDMVPGFITQDVAVPVAFLVTEIVELVMNCDPTGAIAITLTPGDTPERALLSIESKKLGEAICEAHPGRARFERIVTGLARQLRSHLDYDGAIGRYQVAIAITPDSLVPEKN